MKLVYDVNEKPKFGQLLIFAFQQLLAILAATIAVPTIVGNGMSKSAALFGAGVGTIVYLLFTKFKSPVFLGSSFAFLGSMGAAFGGAATLGLAETELGHFGLLIGAVMAGLVYVIIAIIVKIAGVKWINKLMPPVVIGPTVAIIGLSLAGNAISDLVKGKFLVEQTVESLADSNGNLHTLTEAFTQNVSSASPYVCIICGIVTLITVILCSVYGKKMMKLIPFVIGILAGYVVAAIFTAIGIVTENNALMVINFDAFKNMTVFSVPDFTFIKAIAGAKAAVSASAVGKYIVAIAAAYVPVAFVVFAEHIADHKNLSSVIEKDLLEDPGLSRTLLGDGVGSMAGAIFGGCPNTTYGESVGCVAITGNASIVTIFTTAIMAMAISFFGPFVTFLDSIPNCVMGGVCITLYGFIAVSGLKMLQPVDLNDNRNLFTAAVILIAGIGGFTLTFGSVTITEVACALILGIVVNLICSIKKDKKAE